MGTYISILKYRSGDARERFKSKLHEHIGKPPISYKQFRVRIGDQEIPAHLKIKFSERKVLEGSTIIDCEVDSQEEVKNLDGVWNIKRARKLSLFFYEDDIDLEDIVLCVSDNSKSVKAFLEALRYLQFPLPQRLRIRFARIPEFLEKITELGSLGWVWLSKISDNTLRGAGLWGRNLQTSEVVSDLLRRGAEVVALVVVNERKGLKIIISDKGSIYSQRKLDPPVAAGELRELIKFFKNSGLFVFEG